MSSSSACGRAERAEWAERGEWAERTERAERTDIIDLDRYMRAAVRHTHQRQRSRERLVVDAGGVGCPGGVGRARGSRAARGAGDTTDSSSLGEVCGVRRCGGERHRKQLSHDSGLSDGSRMRQNYRSHRRTSEYSKHDDLASSPSAQFRENCERALREQQAQISRVTQLCERLVNTAQTREQLPIATLDEPVTNAPHAREPATRVPCNARERSDELEGGRRRRKPATPDTSDVTSSTISTRISDPRRKDKQRTETCKTYKILLTKLDELRRVWTSRRPLPRASPSSGSVSLRDKVVGTDPSRIVAPTQQTMLTPRVEGIGLVGEGRDDANVHLAVMRVMRATELHVAPQPRANVVGQSVINEGDSRPLRSNSEHEHSGFDLENPVHLYAQAKRMQTLQASVRDRRHEISREHSSTRASKPRTSRASLCGVCRGYWRALRRCVVHLTAGDCACD